MAIEGVRHVVSCRCVLSQLKRVNDAPQYSFPVFSVVDNDNVVPKLAVCPNCGIVHRITDLCRSDILGFEDSRTVVSVDDVRASISNELSSVLDKHDVDVSVWEHVRWIVDNARWGDFVVLQVEPVGRSARNVKILQVLGTALLRVENRYEEIVA